MTRHYVWSFTVEIPETGLPTVTDVAVTERADGPRESGSGSAPIPEARGPIPETLSAEQRDYLLGLAAKKGALDTHALAIHGATTKAEGRELRQQLTALPDPKQPNAQQQGA